MTRILIIEDDSAFAELLDGFLSTRDYSTIIADTVATGKNILTRERIDLVLLDYRLPDGTGMDILDAMRQQNLQIPVIIMTGFHDVRTAVTTIRSGASDYITKPVNPDELLLVVQEILRKHRQPPAQSAPAPLPTFIQGQSEASRELYEHITRVASTDFSVIIQGESGTGKELVAGNIHSLGKRKNAPFIALDCGALSADLANSELFGHVKGAFTGALQNKKGQFEMANGGTIFLDEIGNLSYEVQVKLLRALQEREIQPLGSNERIKVDVRIIVATNDDLLNAVRSGKFREDLYHRINEFKIYVPSLQQRKEDLDLYIDYFTAQANRELNKDIRGVSDKVRAIFMKYDWPGNLRELRNIVKRGVLLSTGNRIDINDLPEEMMLSVPYNKYPAGMDLRSTIDSGEKDLILKTLMQVKFNKSKAARLLDIDRSTLYYKMAKHGIKG